MALCNPDLFFIFFFFPRYFSVSLPPILFIIFSFYYFVGRSCLCYVLCVLPIIVHVLPHFPRIVHVLPHIPRMVHVLPQITRCPENYKNQYIYIYIYILFVFLHFLSNQKCKTHSNLQMRPKPNNHKNTKTHLNQNTKTSLPDLTNQTPKLNQTQQQTKKILHRATTFKSHQWPKNPNLPTTYEPS